MRRSKWQKLKETLGGVFGGSNGSEQPIVDLLDKSWSGRTGTQFIGPDGPSGAHGRGPRAWTAGTKSAARVSHSPRSAHRGAISPVATVDADGSLSERRQASSSGRAATELAATAAPATAATLLGSPPLCVAPAAAAASTASVPRAPEIRASSLPRAMASGGQQPPAAGSGPGAPVSPDPLAPPPALRRVSSTPVVVCTSHTDSLTHCGGSTGSLHKSLSASAVDEATATLGGTAALSAAAAPSGSAGSLLLLHARSSTSMSTSSRENSHHLRGGGSSSKENSHHGSSHLSRQSSTYSALVLPAPAQASTAAANSFPLAAKPPAAAQQQQQTESSQMLPPMQQHPSIAPAPPVSANRTRGSGLEAAPAAPPPPATATTALPTLRQHSAALDILAATPSSSSSSALSSPRHPEDATPTSAAVSLLSLQLRGSATSSMAPSRETSVRRGGRPPAGGLSLALSRESSVRNGSQLPGEAPPGGMYSALAASQPPILAPRLSRELPGDSPWHGDYRHHHQQQHPQHHARPTGHGSGDWMMGAAGHMGLPLDPFAALPCGTAGPLGPGACLPLPAHMEEPAAPPPFQPQQVGSWAQRVTKFPHAQPENQPTVPPAQPTLPPPPGGLDPLLLTAALEALMAAPPVGAGPNVLVGDSALALTGSAEAPPTAAAVPPEEQASQWAAMPPACSSGSAEPALDGAAGAAAGAAGGLSSSWDAASGAVAAGAQLLPVVQLGGSAPAMGLGTSPPNSTHGSTGQLQHSVGCQPLPSDVAAATKEWNRSFMRRWRVVKKRAYLQALGLRALWRVNSPSDRHEPLELLTNDLPQYDNGMRRAWSVTRLTAQLEEGQHHHRRGGGGGSGAHSVSAAQPAVPRQASSANLMHKDPSLAALLLGEVAEVC